MSATDVQPLRAAVLGDRRVLSPAARAEIRALTGPAPRRFLMALLGAWAVMAAAIAWAVYAESVLVSLIAIVIVATRQNVLGLLVHEQAHYLGFKGRWGDLFVNASAAFPLLVLSVEGYAQVHLAHHKDYFAPNDPDFLRKSGPDWRVPMPARRLARLFLRDLLGLNLIALVRGKRPSAGARRFKRAHPTPPWMRIVWLAVVATALTLAGGWEVFLLFWLVPLLTVFQVLVRWGALCEHRYELAGADVASSTPLILLRWWEKLLTPNLNFTLHAYHHYFPGVAFANLARVHEIYLREGLVDEDAVYHGHRAFLRSLIAPARPAMPVAAAPRPRVSPVAAAPAALELTGSQDRTG